MYNAEVREKVGDLHLMNPTSFFQVVGYMMFIFSYYSLLAADSNPLFLKRLGYFFTPDCKYVGVPRVVFSIGIAKMYFPELKIFEIVFG